MVTKEQLQNYRSNRRELVQLRQQIETIEAALYAPRTQRLTGMPAATAGRDRREDMADRHMELLGHYRAKAAELEGEQLALERAMERLDPRARTLLRYRYIDGLTWEQICARMSYCWRQVHNLHSKALGKLLET